MWQYFKLLSNLQVRAGTQPGQKVVLKKKGQEIGFMLFANYIDSF